MGIIGISDSDWNDFLKSNKGKTMKPMNPEEFDPSCRSYPFPNGEIVPGIKVSSASVEFRGQRGPIKEVGVNGCQIDDMIKFARMTIEVFNKKFPCRENSIAITKLQEAELWLMQRKLDREARGVEGVSKK
jgi:hypothetical protein